MAYKQEVGYKVRADLKQIVYNVSIENSPDYLTCLLELKLPTSTTSRSTNTFLLKLPPKCNLHSTNIHAWAISVPYSWNTLPICIRTTPSTPNFKKLLKTHSFNRKH